MEGFGCNCRRFEPFTEVTLQMSQSNVPAPPFVLPLYHEKEQHLEAGYLNKSWRIQHAAKVGLENSGENILSLKKPIIHTLLGVLGLFYTHVCVATGLRI